MQDKLLYTCRLSVASIRQTKSLDFCYMMQETALLNSFFFLKRILPLSQYFALQSLTDEMPKVIFSAFKKLPQNLKTQYTILSTYQVNWPVS